MPDLSISHEWALEQTAVRAGHPLSCSELRAIYWMARCALQVNQGIAPNAALAEFEQIRQEFTQFAVSGRENL